MRDAAHRRSLLLYRIVVEPDLFKRDKIWMEYQKEAQKFINAKTLLIKEDIDDEIRKELDNTLIFSGENAKLQNKAIDLILDGKNDTAYKIIVNKIIPLQDKMMERLTSLLNTVRVVTDDHIANLEKASKYSSSLIISLGALAFILGGLIAIFVTRKIVRTEKNLLIQSHLAEQANHAKSMFLANMSHEIRSPLTAILGFSKSMLTKSLPQNKQQEFTRDIVRNSEHLYQIINDILDVSKIETGQLEIEIIHANLPQIFVELESIAGIPAQNKGLQFNINYQFPIPEFINTDPTRLKQILVNLANNAMKFTDNGSIDINISYSLDSRKMIFEVHDTGIGMSADQLKNIFDEFSQADSSTTRKYGGTGLGLSISRKLAKRLGGELACISKQGKGSTFSFSIDTGLTDKHSLLESKDQIKFDFNSKEHEPNLSLQGHILLAEDTIDNQRLIEMYVTDIGATLTIVDNGLQAVEKCSSKAYDLILMDMQMPIMGGIEATKKIREENIKTPIVFLTANVMKSDIEKCLAAGANDALTKPIDLKKFNQILKKHLKETPPMTNQKSNRNIKLQNITQRFINDLPNRMEVFNKAISTDNWPDIETESHKLKGLGTSMGHPIITELCTNINHSCLEKNHDNIPELINQLEQYIKSISNTN